MANKFGFTGNSSAFKTIGVSLGKAVYIILSASGTILLSLGCAFVGSYETGLEWVKYSGFLGLIKFLIHCPWLYIAIGILFFVLGALGVYRDQDEMLSRNKELVNRNSKLEQESLESAQKNEKLIDQLKYQVDRSQEESQLHRAKVSEIHGSLVESWLKGIAKSIELDTHSRVSIYYADDESFSILARYSQNPALSKMHKQRFALNQGVISQSWQHGHWYEEKAPCYEADQALYNTYMKERYKYTEEELHTIRMKSCRFFGIAIADVDDHIGVILFESTKEGHFSEVTRNTIRDYCDKYQSHLCAFVRNGRNYDKVSSKSHHNANVEDINSLKEKLK